MSTVQPECRLQVAQPPRALLDIRLEKPDRTAVTLAEGTQVGEDMLNEPAVVDPFPGGPQPPPEGLRQPGVPADKTAFQDRRPGIAGASVKPEDVLQSPHTVPDIEPGIPENMQEGLCRLARVMVRIAGRPEHHEIDVGMRTQLSPAIPSQRKDRKMLLPPGFERRESRPNRPIHHQRERSAGFKCTGSRSMARGNVPPAAGKVFAKFLCE